MLPWQKKANLLKSDKSKKDENDSTDSKTNEIKQPPKPRGRPKKEPEQK